MQFEACELWEARAQGDSELKNLTSCERWLTCSVRNLWPTLSLRNLWWFQSFQSSRILVWCFGWCWQAEPEEQPDSSLAHPLGSLYHSRFLLRFANIAGSIETPWGDAETEKDFNFTTGHEFSIVFLSHFVENSTGQDGYASTWPWDQSPADGRGSCDCRHFLTTSHGRWRGDFWRRSCLEADHQPPNSQNMPKYYGLPWITTEFSW